MILSIDQGTTGTTVILFDEALRLVARHYTEITQHYPQPGWVSHDPEEIYQSVITGIQKCLAQAPDQQVLAIGITNQRETTILWDRETGKAVAPAVVWQCRRTAPLCEKYRKLGFESAIRTRTGLLIDAYFSATKIAWLLQEHHLQARAREGKIAFGTVDSWLIYRLTGGKVHATDPSNASRTLLFNLYTQTWDDELLNVFSIPEQMLPQIVDNAGIVGVTNTPGIPEGIPISGIAGDQQAALFGQRCFQAGCAKNTYGTGCFVLYNSGERILRPSGGLLSTVAWRFAGKTHYALEGSVFVGGAAVQWLRDGLGLIQSAPEIESLATSVPDNGGVYFVPAFVGLGAPYWDPYARGTLLGITGGTTKGHVARATLEAIAHQSADLITQMQREGANLAELKVDGGASQNNFLMQFQSNILNLPLRRRNMVESTALGAAMLAGLGIKLWNTPEEIPDFGEERIFTPSMEEEQRHALHSDWKRAVERARDWECESK